VLSEWVCNALAATAASGESARVYCFSREILIYDGIKNGRTAAQPNTILFMYTSIPCGAVLWECVYAHYWSALVKMLNRPRNVLSLSLGLVWCARICAVEGLLWLAPSAALWVRMNYAYMFVCCMLMLKRVAKETRPSTRSIARIYRLILISKCIHFWSHLYNSTNTQYHSK
jgi:hypothetical protein